jgi:hypothetical protein
MKRENVTFTHQKSSEFAVFTRLLRDFAPVHRAIISRQSEAPLQMKRALHLASEVDAYARLVLSVAIGWSSLPFSG